MTNNQRFAAELAVLLVFGAVIWAKAEPRQDVNSNNVPDNVRAHRFVLVDANNRERGTLSMIAGQPQLSLRDKDGGQIAVLDLNFLYFNSSRETTLHEQPATEYRMASQIGVNKDGAGYMQLWDNKHDANVFVGSPNGEAPRIQMTKSDKTIFVKR